MWTATSIGSGGFLKQESTLRAFLAATFVALVVLCAGAQAATIVNTFDNSPAGWTVDRYSPAIFNSPVSFQGDNRLRLGISAPDGASSRPPGYSAAFYNTQGMQTDNPAGTKYVSIDMWLPSSQLGVSGRFFGLWGVGFDSSNTLSSYPIIEFANGGLRGWDSAGFWNDYGLPTGITGDQWVKMAYWVDPLSDMIGYSVNNVILGMVSGYGTASVDKTILQGYNTTDGVEYSVYLDNLTTSTAAVPLPPGALMLGSSIMMLGFGVYATRRKTKRSARVAA